MLSLASWLLSWLLSGLLDPGMLLESLLLADSWLLRGADLPWARRAHLNTGGASHGHSWSLLRMTSVLMRVNCSCWTIYGEALVLEMRRRGHVMSSCSGLSSHCRTLMCGCGLLLLNCLRLRDCLMLLGGGHG
jgi:hypothetical protein